MTNVSVKRPGSTGKDDEFTNSKFMSCFRHVWFLSRRSVRKKWKKNSRRRKANEWKGIEGRWRSQRMITKYNKENQKKFVVSLGINSMAVSIRCIFCRAPISRRAERGFRAELVRLFKEINSVHSRIVWGLTAHHKKIPCVFLYKWF
jgi:hypothetical protein